MNLLRINLKSKFVNSTAWRSMEYSLKVIDQNEISQMRGNTNGPQTMAKTKDRCRWNGFGIPTLLMPLKPSFFMAYIPSKFSKPR